YAYSNKWTISTVVAQRLGLRRRQTKIELFLTSTEIAWLRSTESTSSQRLVDEPCVRSFVTSAILKVKTWCHHQAQQNVAYNRGSTCD
ncbi:hypothetical protein C8J56DRAFT_768635, partial [Mycena floridula]